jgi:hypothetical protein
MEIIVRKIAHQLKLSQTDLLTRPVGKKLYTKAVSIVENCRPEEVVVIDFSGYSVIDPSCVDEFLISLVRDSMKPEKPFFLRLSHISPTMDMTIQGVFDTYSEFSGMKIGIITEELVSRRGYYIGKVTDDEKELLSYLRITDAASPEEIARRLERDVHGIYLALEALYARRMVRKEEGSKRKGYTRV